MTDGAVANTAMEGSGYYNRHSSLQGAGIELALPHLRAAALAIPIADGAPLVIADFGCSQGRNSLRPIGCAIDALRGRCGADRAIEVIHTDLPSNDFTSLFTTVNDDGASYLRGDPRVFPSAIGRTYFEANLPPGRLSLGWTSWTLHWMSRNPIEVADQAFAVVSASADARDKVRQQLADDWRRFLLARAGEMRVGARLVCIMMGRRPDQHGWEWVLDGIWRAAVEIADENQLSAEELLRFTVPVAGRSVADLQAPFSGGGLPGLQLESAEVVEAPDPLWDRFLEAGDTRQFAGSWEGTMRAVCGPVAEAAFAARPNAADLATALFRRFGARAAAAPQRLAHFAAIAVVAKTASA